MPEKYEPQEALSILRSILANDGDLVISDHCYLRMKERSVDDVDIQKVLEENGVIRKAAEFDVKKQKYKYTVEGFDSENEPIDVIVNISEKYLRVVAITVITR